MCHPKKRKKRCNLSSLTLIIVYLLLIAIELLRGHCNLSESLRFILAINSISNLSKKKKKKTYVRFWCAPSRNIVKNLILRQVYLKTWCL